MKREDIEEILRLQSIYTNMMQRCHTPSHYAFADYGARGIHVSSEWRGKPAAFIHWAVNNGAKPGLHLDRMDNAAGYSPDNCQFVTPQVNGRNRRNTVWATAFGETKPLGAWMEDDRCAVAYPTLIARIKAGWDAEKAITQPSQRTTNRSDNE